jgi:hypothetical protein
MGPPPIPGTQQFNGGLVPQNSAEQQFLSRGQVAGVFEPSQVGNEGFVTMPPGYKSSTGLTTVPTDSAINYWWQMPEPEKISVIDLMRQSGVKVNDSARAFTEWTKLNQQAGSYSKALNQNISVYDILRQNIALNVQKPGGTWGASGYSSVVNLTNPDDAQVLVNNSLNQYLGRDATEEERGAFLDTLNRVERKNPIVTTKTSRSGGTNVQQVAKEFALSQETAAEDTANTTYMNWMAEALMQNPNEGVVSGL